MLTLITTTRLKRLAAGILVLAIAPTFASAQDHDHLSSPTVLPHNIPDFCAVGITKTSAASGAWSSAATWSPAGVPGANDVVSIAAGHTVPYDSTSAAAIKCIGVNGQLVFRTDINTSLKVGTLMVMATGTLQIGTTAAPIASNVTAEVIIANQPLVQASDPEQFGTGLIGFGTIKMHGGLKAPTFVRLNQEPVAGATTLSLEEAATGWRVGDRIVVPDTRHLKWNEVSGSRIAAPQWEERTIAAISADSRTITLNQALQFSHLGARDSTNALRFLPHVGNLTRNVSVRSEVPIGGTGTQGHAIFADRADVDIRYSQFRDLGRTIASPTCSTAGCGFTGGNQIGRYPIHFHHLMGPIATPTNGYQYTFIGNAVDGGSTVHDRRWGIAIHNTHYGIVSDNVVYNYGGASITTEDGSESYNVIEHNFALRGRGNGDRLGDGNEGMGFWFRGPNNYIRRNVAANFDTNAAEGSYGYKYFMRTLGTIQIPTAKGQPTTQYVPRDGNTMPVLEFSDNEVYGAVQGGLTYWWLSCLDPACTPNPTESVFRNLKIWHVYNVGIYHYPGARITFDGLVVLGKDPANAACCGRGFHGEDYSANDIKIINSEIQGMINGIIPSTAGTGLQTVENTYLNNENDVVIRTLYSANGGGWLPARHTVFRNVQFQGNTTIEMNWDVKSGGQANTSQLDEVLVYAYRGNANDNFRVYYNEQATQNVAGGLACGTAARDNRPEISGIVCPIGASASAPIVSGVVPNSGPSAGGTAVTITGTGFSNGATVTFGTTSASSVNVVSATTITAMTPARSAGVVTLAVRNADGQIGTLANGFTYTGCTYTLSPTSQTVVAAGGTGSVTVTAGAGCTWSASSNAAWLTSSSSGSGNGTVNYAVAANSGGSRSAALTIGGQAFTLTQNAASGCTFSLSPSSQTFSATGGAGTANITVGTGCTWTATSAASWIGTSSTGSGNGTVNFTVGSNTGISRSGTFSVGGQTFTVSQDASASTGTLVAAYGFNEGSGTTLGDLTGNGHSGTVSGAVWSAGGRFSGGLSFDGVNDAVSIPDNPSLDLGITGTVEAWVKLDTLNRWNGIFGKAAVSSDAAHNYALEINTANRASCVIGNGSSINVATSTATLQANTFYHLACVWDGAQLRIYVNGVQSASVTQTLTPAANGAPLVLGQYGGNVDYLDGIVDELRVYSRALSAAEILADMNAPVAQPPVNQPPSLTNPGNRTNAIGAVVSLQLVASDANGDTLTYAASNLPGGLGVNSVTGLIGGTIASNAVGSYAVAVTASDNVSSTNASFTWTVTGPTNQPPTIANPGNRTNAVGSVISLQLGATDPNGDSLTYAAGNLPPGLAVNSATGLISGTIASSGAGSYTVTISASDAVSTTTASFAWTVTGPANQPPTLTNPGTQTHVAGTAVSLQLTGSDPNGDTVTYSASSLPSGLSINTATGLVSGTIGSTAVGSRTVTVTVSDAVLSASVNFTWTVTAAPQPTIALDRSELRFGATNGGTVKTSSQDVRLSVIGSSNLSWTVTASDPSIVSVSPPSGVGTRTFAVSANTSTMAPGASIEATLTVAAAGASNSPQQINVVVTNFVTGVTAAPFGFFDTPVDGATGLSGSIAVTGWALDDIEIARVEIWRDPVTGEATHSRPGDPADGKVFIGVAPLLEDARPDVDAAFAVPFDYRSGWGYLMGTRGLPFDGNGTFRIYAVAYDKDGHATLLGAKTITVDNQSAVKPFGAIDTPGQGETIAGSAYVNFGWALTPVPKYVPQGVSGVQVFIDGVMVGTPGCFSPRQDITNLFPGFANTPEAVRCFIFDTTAYSNGLHTIGWLATDDSGQFDGIGSRFFRVFNTGGASALRLAESAETETFATVQGSHRSTFADATTVFPLLGQSVTSLTLPDRREQVVVAHGARSWRDGEPVRPSAGGLRTFRVNELERVEVLVRSGGETQSGDVFYSGYRVIEGELQKLPLGSSFDTATGVFYWQPPAGYLGDFDFAFVRWDGDAPVEQVTVRINIRPAVQNDPAQMFVDTPVEEAELAQPFAIAGWAIDRSAWTGTGVDTLHVWAYPNPGSGEAPMFLGVATNGGSRPDVGQVFGDQFAEAGYGLIVEGLQPGIYSIVVYAHSAVTQAFNNARAVRVTVIR